MILCWTRHTGNEEIRQETGDGSGETERESGPKVVVMMMDQEWLEQAWKGKKFRLVLNDGGTRVDYVYVFYKRLTCPDFPRFVTLYARTAPRTHNHTHMHASARTHIHTHTHGCERGWREGGGIPRTHMLRSCRKRTQTYKTLYFKPGVGWWMGGGNLLQFSPTDRSLCLPFWFTELVLACPPP